MSRHAKVVWTEGMFLTPQHLQQWDRYHEYQLAEIFLHARSFPYGVDRIELDADAIRNGRVVLIECRGVLPGGTPFWLPKDEEAPEARSVEGHFPLQEPAMPVFLGVRRPREGQPDIAETDGLARYRSELARLTDENSGTGEREVRVARRNFRVVFADENPGEFDPLKIAEIVRRPEGGYGYREEYVPPLLAAGASEAVVRALRRLLEILVAKSSELADRRRLSGKGLAEFGRDEVASFWLLSTVNGSIPVLAHLLRHRAIGPDAVYLALARLAGELSTLGESHPRDLPPYEHENFGPALADLSSRIPALLETIIPKAYTRIDLEAREGSIHVGRILDERVLDPAMSFYLGLHADVSSSEMQSAVPSRMKVASLDRLDFLVANALKGVGMRLVQALPAALPYKSGYVYFQLDRQGEVWDGVAGSKTIAIYAPPDVPGLRLELVALRE